jgi:hypothetical protein
MLKNRTYLVKFQRCWTPKGQKIKVFARSQLIVAGFLLATISCGKDLDKQLVAGLPLQPLEKKDSRSFSSSNTRESIHTKRFEGSICWC